MRCQFPQRNVTSYIENLVEFTPTLHLYQVLILHPKEKKGFLTLKDNLQVSVSYNDRDKIKEEVNKMKSYELPEVVVIGHRTQKVEKNETEKGGTKHETEQ